MIGLSLFCTSVRFINYIRPRPTRPPKLIAAMNIHDLHNELGESHDLDRKNSRIKHKKLPNEVKQKFVESKEGLSKIGPVKKMPRSLLVEKSSSRSMNIIVKDTACQIVASLKPHFKSFKGHVIEVNGGLGVLTQELIKCNLSSLRVYGVNNTLHQQLQELISKCKPKCDVQLFKENFRTLWFLINLDRRDKNNRVHDFLKGLPTAPWESDPVAKVIAFVSDRTFIIQSLYSIVFQHGLCGFGRPEFFLVMPPHILQDLISGPQDGYKFYQKKSVLFQLLCEYTVLLQVPVKSFLPPLKLNSTQEKLHILNQEIEEGMMVLVKITPRSNLFQRIPLELMQPLWYYTNVMFQKRRAKLIQMFENWVPGCGPRLIAHGYTIYTDCGSLVPEEHLKLFLEFSSWPEYKSCPFHSNMDTVLYKMLSSEVDEEMALIKSESTRNRKNSTLNDTLDTDFDISLNHSELLNDEKYR